MKNTKAIHQFHNSLVLFFLGPSTAVPPSTTTEGVITTECADEMIDADDVQTTFDVMSYDNPEGGDILDVFSEGWSPEEGSNPFRIELVPKDGVDVDGVKDVTLKVQNVVTVTVVITKEDQTEAPQTMVMSGLFKS